MSDGIKGARSGREHVVRRFAVTTALFFTLSACQTAGNRQAEDQAQFDAAVRAQRKEIADVCNRLPEIQRRYCAVDAPR
jgi:hypothetical protein